MLKLTNIYESIVKERHPKFSSDYFIQRVPFLKDYEVQYAPSIYPHPRQKERVELLFNKTIKDVTLKIGDDIVNIPKLYVVSKFVYYPHKIDDNTFHNFIIDNKVQPMQPEDMDRLSYRVFSKAASMMDEQLSYSEQIMLPEGQTMDEKRLDEIINEINKRLFKLEEFVSEAYGNQAY